jgi:DNA-binding GntR family transcriptional regulator
MSTPTTIVNFVHDKLREGITSGRYPAGARLNESQIAREFNISRIPVREALVRLRESGLVMKHDRRGMFVTQLSDEEVQRINSVRIVLEAEALRLCRLNLDKKQAAKLKGLVEKMEKWRAESQVDAAQLDIEFHRALWTAAGNPRLYEILDSLSTVLFAHATIQHANTETIKWRLNHHRSLLDVALGESSISPEEAVISHLKSYYEQPEKFSSLVAP